MDQLDRVCRVTEELTYDVQGVVEGGFSSGRGCVDKGFTSKHLGKNAECVCNLYKFRKGISHGLYGSAMVGNTQNVW